MKQLQPNEVLLNENKIEGELSRIQKEEMKALIKQRPNTKIFGTVRLYWFIYNIGSHGKPRKKVNQFLMRVGEAPVVLDSSFIYSTEQQMQQYLFNKGYYNATVNHSIRIARKKAYVTYHVNADKPYRISFLHYNISDTSLARVIYSDTSQNYIHLGDAYDLDNLIKEKNRVTDVLRNNGYYYFTRDYVNYDADSSYKTHQLILSLNVKNPGLKQHRKYLLRQVTFELNNENSSNRHVDTFYYKGVRYLMRGYNIKPQVLQRMIDIRAMEPYNQAAVQSTYTRLLDMQLFRFVNIGFEPYESDSSGYLDCRIRVSPHMVNEIVEEPQLITSDQNQALNSNNFRNYGIANVFQFRNKNTFRRGELFQISWRASLEVQAKGGSGRNGRFFNSTEQSITASLIQPRLVGLRWAEELGNPSKNKSSVNMSFTYETNVDFTRRLINLGFNYQQKRGLFMLSFSPVEISYIKTNPSDAFKLRIDTLDDIFLKNLFSNNLIIANRFTLVFSNQGVKRTRKSYTYFIYDPFELAGNLLYAVHSITGEKKDTALGSYKFLSTNYYQYYKTTFDLRHYHVLDDKNTLVYRFFAGMGLPYGNSSVLPFEKRYFMGGANDLRAWRPRVLGPGSYLNYSSLQLDRSGEIKLEANVEYRFDIFNQYLEGALFGDAGNIWLARKNSVYPNGEFNFSRFSKELAMDAGIGFRMNFSFFILRLDMAIPLRDPGFEESKRWVVEKLFDKAWFRDNYQLNLGIGYPF